MNFNSVSYFLFLPLSALLCFALPQRWQQWWLLLCSYFFYMQGQWQYGILLLCSTAISFVSARFMQHYQQQPTYRCYSLWAGLASDLGLLLWFKYATFVWANILLLGTWLGYRQLPHWQQPWALPLGISFYTFQSVGYLLDVYKGKISAERHWLSYALYLSFFPQLVAGPIEPAHRLLPQLAQKFRFSWHNITVGSQLIVWGLFKKMVVADNLADYVDAVFAHLHLHSGATLAWAMVAFVWQVYCDFSAYSDIALGSARILGVQLMLNFDRPFAARSYTQLWQRWHISLTQFMRQYVYLPLGGNQASSRWQWYGRIMLVYLLVGFWHGAAWTFIGFGFLHGITIVLAHLTQPYRQRINHYLGWQHYPRLQLLTDRLLVFALFAFNCIIFRCDSLADWWYIVSHLCLPTDPLLPAPPLLLALPATAALIALQTQQTHTHPFDDQQTPKPWQQVVVVYVLLGFITLLLGNKNANLFFYFQF